MASQNLVIIVSGNGLAPNRNRNRCQAITWIDVDLWIIGPFDTDLNEF